MTSRQCRIDRNKTSIQRRGQAELIDGFIPQPDVCERHEILVHAPANVVMDVARQFEMQSIPLVRAIFWLRAKLLGGETTKTARRRLAAQMAELGWSVLAEEPGRSVIAGAACQPWQADVVFTPISAEQFADYAEPDQVKIIWTLEAVPLEPALTRFVTETRAVATDDDARAKFRRYWRIFGIGVHTFAGSCCLPFAAQRNGGGAHNARRRPDAGCDHARSGDLAAENESGWIRALRSAHLETLGRTAGWRTSMRNRGFLFSFSPIDCLSRDEGVI